MPISDIRRIPHTQGAQCLHMLFVLQPYTTGVHCCGCQVFDRNRCMDIPHMLPTEVVVSIVLPV